MDAKKSNYTDTLLDFLVFQESISAFFIESSLKDELIEIIEQLDRKELAVSDEILFEKIEEFSKTEKNEEVEDINSLEALKNAISNCKKCRLAEKRKNTVPGEGDPNARLMFIGEGPGATEDETGLPFVGEAGQLLTKIIENGLKIPRSSVYICNIVKCRPPMNREPMPDEAESCLHFVKKQIELVKPEAIVLLGRVALRYLLDETMPMKDARLKEFYYNNIRVFPTYHPSALLRNAELKKPVWEDMKKVISYLKL